MPNATVTDVKALPANLTVEQLQDFLGISRQALVQFDGNR
jgi:hypothetical protein